MNEACKRCGGRCCLIFFLKADGNPLLEEWLSARADACMGGMLIFNRPCSKFNNGLCTIYDKRPQVCKDKVPCVENCQFAIEYTGGNVDEVFV